MQNKEYNQNIFLAIILFIFYKINVCPTCVLIVYMP